VESHFHYFSEIEEYFQRRRGTALLLSTLDWALIETWKDAGIPLEAVLRGIDAAFDRYDARPSKTRRVNSLAYCAQEVLAASEDMQEAAVGTVRKPAPEAGFERERVGEYLRKNAEALRAAKVPDAAKKVAAEAAETLRELAGTIPANLEDLERHLTVLEDKLFAVLLAATPDAEVIAARADADRELAPYRRNMKAPQIEQLQKQYVHKRLLERYGVPRLSLFYL
jgi:hypothetical protein